MIILSVMLIVVVLLTSVVATDSWRSALMESGRLYPHAYGDITVNTLVFGSVAAAAAGVYGLIKARTSDRRWLAVYIMSLAVVTECVLFYAIVTNLDLSISSFWWQGQWTFNMAAVAVIGFGGTGVSLC